MIGTRWRREQGLVDPLLRRMVADRWLENILQWTKKDDVRSAANARWMALADYRDGTVNPERREITDPGHITEEIKAKALELGADLAGCCALTPIMIDEGFDMPHRSVVSFIVKEDYANVLKGSRAIEAETCDVYVRVAEI